MLADEFVLTLRNVFLSGRLSNIPFANKNTIRDFSRVSPYMSKSNGNKDKSASLGERDKHSCLYCLDQGHLIAECQAWKKKSAEAKTKKAALVQTMYVRMRLCKLFFFLALSISLL